MLTVPLPEDCSVEAFRQAARKCLARDLPPDQVMFTSGDEGSLFGPLSADVEEGREGFVKVRRSFLGLISRVLCQRGPVRFALLYRLLWRLCQGERGLFDNIADRDVMLAARYAKAVDKDVYRMHAYVRFAAREIDGKEVFVAWHEPTHRVLRRAAPFFVDRFTNMDWLIATPVGTAAWHGGALSFG